MKSRATAIALLALWVGGCGEGTIPDQTAPAAAGKADSTRKKTGAQATCVLDGAFVFYGDFPSFSSWSFSFADGALIDSHTDDLPTEAWPTTLVRDPSDLDLLSLVQITHGSDAIITTTLYLERTCSSGAAGLEATAGQTVSFDLTSDESSVETHHPLRSEAECASHVAGCRADCSGERDPYVRVYCFETCMDEHAWPCPKLCDDGQSLLRPCR